MIFILYPYQSTKDGTKNSPPLTKMMTDGKPDTSKEHHRDKESDVKWCRGAKNLSNDTKEYK